MRYFIESQVQNLVEIRNAMNSLTNLKIKDQFEKIDGPTNREKIDGPTNREKIDGPTNREKIDGPTNREKIDGPTNREKNRRTNK